MSVGRKKLSVCQNNVAAFSCCCNVLQYQQTSSMLSSILSFDVILHNLHTKADPELGVWGAITVFSCDKFLNTTVSYRNLGGYDPPHTHYF